MIPCSDEETLIYSPNGLNNQNNCICKKKNKHKNNSVTIVPRYISPACAFASSNNSSVHREYF